MDITSFFCTPSKYKCFSHINTLSFFLEICYTFFNHIISYRKKADPS
nr:MAG TPA: hypothetical protein [Caudoviricetes sp.]